MKITDPHAVQSHQVDRADVRSSPINRINPANRVKNREEPAADHADRLALALHDRPAGAPK